MKPVTATTPTAPTRPGQKQKKKKQIYDVNVTIDLVSEHKILFCSDGRKRKTFFLSVFISITHKYIVIEKKEKRCSTNEQRSLAWIYLSFENHFPNFLLNFRESEQKNPEPSDNNDLGEKRTTNTYLLSEHTSQSRSPHSGIVTHRLDTEN